MMTSIFPLYKFLIFSLQTFIAQEQICTKRLWVLNKPHWRVEYGSILKKQRVYIKLVEASAFEDIPGVFPLKKKDIPCGEKVLRVFFFFVEIPLWILFFALGVVSDKEALDMINIHDVNIFNILVASIHEADRKCEGFRKDGRALNHIDELTEKLKFPPEEGVKECISKYLFPNLSGPKQKARFLAYMVKCLLQAYIGRRKCENRDDFKNKRLELAGELLEREMRVHIRHAERQMVKAMQRDLYGDSSLRPIEHYLDASIVNKGLTSAFSTGNWSHFGVKKTVTGVVTSLGRTNPLKMIADTRKTRLHVQYAGKVGDARYPYVF